MEIKIETRFKKGDTVYYARLSNGEKKPCGTCGGTGRITITKANGETLPIACPGCFGTGKVTRNRRYVVVEDKVETVRIDKEDMFLCEEKDGSYSLIVRVEYTLDKHPFFDGNRFSDDPTYDLCIYKNKEEAQERCDRANALCENAKKMFKETK